MQNTVNLKFKEFTKGQKDKAKRRNLVTELKVDISVPEATQVVRRLQLRTDIVTTIDIIREIKGSYVREPLGKSTNSLIGRWLKIHAEEIGITKIGRIPSKDDLWQNTSTILWRIN